MNNCCFTGYLVNNPDVYMVDKVLKADLVVVIYNYRKVRNSKDKSRTPVYLKCEAWHTGAEIIERFAVEGTKITFQATAKNVSKENTQMIFRINEFDLCHPEFED